MERWFLKGSGIIDNLLKLFNFFLNGPEDEKSFYGDVIDVFWDFLWYFLVFMTLMLLHIWWLNINPMMILNIQFSLAFWNPVVNWRISLCLDFRSICILKYYDLFVTVFGLSGLLKNLVRMDFFVHLKNVNKIYDFFLWKKNIRLFP